MYKVIFIDWNKTLSFSLFWDHLKDLEESNPMHLNNIQNSLFGKLDHLVKPWMRGEYTTEYIVQKLAEETGLDYEHLLKEFILSCQTMKIDPEVLSVIQQLRKKGIKVVIATDNMDALDRWTRSSLKLNENFDDILNSYSIKALKGDITEDGESAFFMNYLKEHKLKKNETVLLDDSQIKDEIAKKHGIDFIHITTENTLLKVLNTLLDK